MPLRVGLDASASATKRPTGVARAISSLVGSLRTLEAPGDRDALDLSVLYRLSRLRRRSTFLPGGRLFHERFSKLYTGQWNQALIDSNRAVFDTAIEMGNLESVPADWYTFEYAN